jgi:small subunit ribosomal protein S15Ae
MVSLIHTSRSYLLLVEYAFLSIVLDTGYIGEFEYVDDHRAGKIVVELNGRLNKCGVISPRFDVGVKEIEGWTARLLPSRQVCGLGFMFVVNWTSLLAQCHLSFYSDWHSCTHDLQFGYIVLTASAGIMDHEEARRKNVGGKVLGFFY